MSQEINNSKRRKEAIKDMLRQLHEGKTVDEVRHIFEAAFDGVSAGEISQAEQALINEGVPVSEVQRLCDVHSAVFKGSIEEIHAPSDPGQMPGHPAHTLKQENRKLEELINRRIKPLLLQAELPYAQLEAVISELAEIDRHYSRKENLFFPYMEKYGITAPPKVMWGVDDEIRALIRQSLKQAQARDAGVKATLNETFTRVTEMIFKEDSILLPMTADAFTMEEWAAIAAESDEIGYSFIEKPIYWQPQEEPVPPPAAVAPNADAVRLPTGFFSVLELTHVLNTLPMDITFVGKDDTVRYFSQGSERVFPRTKAIIGRAVSNCHPPASVHVVEGIVEDLKSGRKSHEDFWINMGGKLILIRYFAVRDEQGEYLGVLEVTQDIAPIQKITGEKRLVSG